MKISIKVTPRSSVNEVVEKMPDGTLKIKLKAAPVDGAANDALIELLSDYYKKPKSAFVIKTGKTSRRKIVEII